MTAICRLCQRDLADCALPDDERAALYCRLGERLFYRGDRDAAVDCARAAFDLRDQDQSVADFCAWLFSNCERHREAAAAYQRLLERRPDWAAGHRHASGSFAVAGEVDRAVFHAIRACELEPGSSEFAVHAGGLLASAGRHADALGHLARAAEIDPTTLRSCASCRRWPLLSTKSKRRSVLARRAHPRRPPTAPQHSMRPNCCCVRTGMTRRPTIVTANLVLAGADHVAYRLLSAAQMMRGQIEGGIEAIDRALALAPGAAEYHLHRGNLLYRLGRFDEAAAALDQAASLDPENPAARRSQLAVFLDSGRYREALAVGGELIRTAPDNEEYARAVLEVLNRRLETIDGDYIVIGERCPRPDRAPGSQPGCWAALRTQWRVVHALIVRETRTRFGDSTLGYGWALLEPILHILTLSLVFAVLMHGRPPIGNQFFIFYYTGIIPYHLFVHTSSSMTYAVTANGSLLQLPLVSTFDVILARALLELVTDLLVAVILLAGFGALGLGTLPNDFAGVSAAVATVWLLGCGIGFVNAVVNAFFPSWDKIWAQLTRLLYFCSGIFYVPGNMPDWIRNILAWNPVLHAVDWFRSSFSSITSRIGSIAPISPPGRAGVAGGVGARARLRRKLYEPQ